MQDCYVNARPGDSEVPVGHEETGLCICSRINFRVTVDRLIMPIRIRTICCMALVAAGGAVTRFTLTAIVMNNSSLASDIGVGQQMYKLASEQRPERFDD